MHSAAQRLHLDSRRHSKLKGNSMLRRLCLTTAALLIAGPVLAGSLTQSVVVGGPTVPVIVAPTAAFGSGDWSGGYVGGQLSYGRYSTDRVFDQGDEFAEEIVEGDGALFGVHAGYLFDFGRFVAGGEIDYDRTQIGLEGVDSEAGQDFGHLDSIARAKLRLGIDGGRVMSYVTAGLARASFDFEGEAAEAGIDDTTSGIVFGGGVSFGMSDNLMVGLEVLSHNFYDGPEFGDEAGGGNFEYETMINTVAVRGSFRF